MWAFEHDCKHKIFTHIDEINKVSICGSWKFQCVLYIQIESKALLAAYYPVIEVSSRPSLLVSIVSSEVFNKLVHVTIYKHFWQYPHRESLSLVWGVVWCWECLWSMHSCFKTQRWKGKLLHLHLHTRNFLCLFTCILNLLKQWKLVSFTKLAGKWSKKSDIHSPPSVFHHVAI